MANNNQELPEDDDEAAAVIVQRLKSQGMFDTMRRECLSDIDTKPAFLNLSQRIERYVSNFLDRQEWRQDLNKNQLRERLRRNLTESNMMKYGIEHLVDGAVQTKKRSFQPEVEKIVKEMLGFEDEDLDWDSDRNEPDVDNSQQDMDVDSNESNSTPGQETEAVHNSRSDVFIPSFVEVHNSSSQSSSSPPRMSIIQQLFEPIIKKEEVTPTKISIQINLPSKQEPSEPQSMVKDMDIETSDDGSNQHQNEDWPSSEVKEESTGEVVERPPSKNSISDIQLPAESPPTGPPPLTKNYEISVTPIGSESPIGSNSPIEESEEEMDSIEAPYSPVGRREEQVEESVDVDRYQREPNQESVEEPAPVSVEEPAPVSVEETSQEEIQEQIQKIKEGDVSSVIPDTVEGIKKESVKEEPVEYLSDVSSVHTSDLSDFDDRVSPSSEEEKQPSPKKPAKVVGRGRKSKEGSKEKRISTDGRKRRASVDKSLIGQPNTESRPSTGSSTGRRERKVNPKYASDEYSSIYNRKKNQIIEEDISSDEDFEGIDNEESNTTPLQDEVSNASSEGDHGKVVEVAESAFEEGVETKLKNVRKVVKRQEKYDVSDLYKPRPVIGASTSRRNRSATNPEQS